MWYVLESMKKIKRRTKVEPFFYINYLFISFDSMGEKLIFNFITHLTMVHWSITKTLTIESVSKDRALCILRARELWSLAAFTKCRVHHVFIGVMCEHTTTTKKNRIVSSISSFAWQKNGKKRAKQYIKLLKTIFNERILSSTVAFCSVNKREQNASTCVI